MQHERRQEIVAKILQNRMVKVSDLVAEYNVSIETIRRDLEYLEKQGSLSRVYGGAVLNKLYGNEPPYTERKIIHYAEKRAIAAAVVQMVEDGDILFIDVGTTALEVVYRLNTKKGLTVITNSTQVALAAISYDTCRVILLGGQLRQGELSVSGFLADKGIEYFNANKAIIGVGGITLKNGVTDYHIEEANTRRAMVNQADKVIAVADFSKFGVTAMNNSCPLQKIHALVTDKSTPAQTVADFRSVGVNIVIAPDIIDA